ncbi:MAG: YceH family protein [Verrucomicrobiota bacterium]
MSATDPLNVIEARILGCLLEKEITLPDYYPLTLNALTAACNQTTNRDPIMSLDENQIRRAVEAMKTRGWIFEISIVGARVSKYRHNLKSKLPGLEKPATSLLCVLLLRGEQTLGELRQRTERLHAFPDLESVDAELLNLVGYSEGPLAACLPAGAGRRVAQYVQLLTGEPEAGLAPREEIIYSASAAAPAPAPAPAQAAEDQAWRQRMEMEIELLKAQLTRLKVRLGVED